MFITSFMFFSVELGDYDPSIHVGNYVTEMRLLLRQTDAIEARIQVSPIMSKRTCIYNVKKKNNIVKLLMEFKIP